MNSINKSEQLLQEAIRLIEQLVYYSQIHTVTGVSPAVFEPHLEVWKKGQQFLRSNAETIDGEYRIKSEQAEVNKPEQGEDFTNDAFGEEVARQSWLDFKTDTFQKDVIKAIKGTGYEDRNPLFRVRLLVENYKRCIKAISKLEEENYKLRPSRPEPTDSKEGEQPRAEGKERECPLCGNGFINEGTTFNPILRQCEGCNGKGYISAPIDKGERGAGEEERVEELAEQWENYNYRGEGKWLCADIVDAYKSGYAEGKLKQQAKIAEQAQEIKRGRMNNWKLARHYLKACEECKQQAQEIERLKGGVAPKRIV